MKKRGKKIKNMKGRDGHGYPRTKPEVRPVQASTKPKHTHTRGYSRGR